MGFAGESILGLLELLVAFFLFFGLPALIFVVSFALALLVVTRIGSSLLTVVFTKFPTVARPLNALTMRISSSARESNFERRRLMVVGCLSVLYAVGYILSAWGAFAIYRVIGRNLFTTIPEWYMRAVEYSFPIVALLFTLPVILAIYTYRDAWRDSASRSRTVYEWGITLLLLNVLVPVGLYAAVFGSTLLSKWLFSAVWRAIETIGKLLLEGVTPGLQ